MGCDQDSRIDERVVGEEGMSTGYNRALDLVSDSR
jgi:hypothetical protein